MGTEPAGLPTYFNISSIIFTEVRKSYSTGLQ